MKRVRGRLMFWEKVEGWGDAKQRYQPGAADLGKQSWPLLVHNGGPGVCDWIHHEKLGSLRNRGDGGRRKGGGPGHHSDRTALSTTEGHQECPENPGSNFRISLSSSCTTFGKSDLRSRRE
jgi:hypothetical protein